MAGIDYVVNVDDPTTPLDTNVSRKGAAELRAIKNKILGLFGVAPTGFKNRFINGDMRIDQLLEYTALVTGVGAFMCADCWWSYRGTAAANVTIQNQALPASAVPGMTRYIRYNVPAIAAPAAADSNGVYTDIEGFNVQDLNFGTGIAKTITLSFWIRATTAGLYAVSLANNAQNRSYVTTYTVNLANAWEYKTITIPGDIAGAWTTDNTIGLQIVFDMGYGSNFETATPNVWTATLMRRTAACVKLINSVAGAALDLTGVQLEVGTIATSFDFRDYEAELARCQRYYEKSFNAGVVPAQNAGINGCLAEGLILGGAVASVCMHTDYKVQKRATPTVIFYNPSAVNAFVRNNTRVTDATVTGLQINGTDGLSIAQTGLAGWVSGDTLYIHWTADARL